MHHYLTSNFYATLQIMYSCCSQGEYIDHSIGVALGISTMAGKVRLQMN